MPELSLDHHAAERPHAPSRRRARAELVRREPPPYAGSSGRVMQLLRAAEACPPPTGGRPVDHAEQRADRQLAADLEPRVER